jgi:hypothetical protein
MEFGSLCRNCGRIFWMAPLPDSRFPWWDDHDICPECVYEDDLRHLRTLSQQGVLFPHHSCQLAIVDYVAYPAFGRYMMRLGAFKLMLLGWQSSLRVFWRGAVARSADGRQLPWRIDILDYMLMFVVPYSWDRYMVDD